MRSLFLGVVVVAFWWVGVGSGARADEHLIVSGGPALRFFEKYKKNSHDRFWGNFIHSVYARLPEIRKGLKPGDTITWLVFRPGYITRGREDGQNYLERIVKGCPKDVRLIWFDHRDGLVNYLNRGQRRKEVKVARFEYFGHANKWGLMFDYSNRVDGAIAEPLMLHIRNLKDVKQGVFSKDAFCKSWGCHSGEAYSEAWRKQFQVAMIGAVGKTDYSNGGVPIISTPEGHWTE